METATKPIVILNPAPQLRDRIFSPDALKRLNEAFEVIDLEANPDPELFDKHLPNAFAVVGQPDLDTATLEKAKNLKAIVNVEGNFFPNVDYRTAFLNGVRVLGCGTAYSQAVAEFSLGMALDLARGITREDRAARQNAERYVSESNADAILLRRATVGILGYGNLGKALHALIRPFNNEVLAYDPWLPDAVLRDAGTTPASLEKTLRESQFIFVFATATEANQHLLDAAALDLIRDNARIILVSRANVVDYDALLERLSAGRFYAGIDVWPVEPVPADSPFRSLENVLLSPHRAGGIPEAFHSIGDMVNDDLELLVAGLAPVRLQAAAPELVSRYRNKPVG